MNASQAAETAITAVLGAGSVGGVGIVLFWFLSKASVGILSNRAEGDVLSKLAKRLTDEEARGDVLRAELEDVRQKMRRAEQAAFDCERGRQQQDEILRVLRFELQALQQRVAGLGDVDSFGGN